MALYSGAFCDIIEAAKQLRRRLVQSAVQCCGLKRYQGSRSPTHLWHGKPAAFAQFRQMGWTLHAGGIWPSEQKMVYD